MSLGTITLRLVGHLKTEAQLATSPPNTPPNSPKAQHTNDHPLPVPHLSRVVDGTRVKVPYFPSTGLRGRLRRLTEEVVRTALVGEGSQSPFELATHHYLALGGVKQAGQEQVADIVAAQERRLRNPVIGLWGASVPWDAGRVFVTHAIASEPVAVEIVSQVRQDDFKRSPEKLQVLAPAEREAWLRQVQEATEDSAAKRDVRNRLKALRSLIAKATGDELAQLREEERTLSESTGGKVNINQVLAGFEAIPMDTTLQQSFTLSGVTPVEAGLFLSALARFARHPYLGSHAAQGCGLVSGQWSAEIRQQADQPFKSVGQVVLLPFEGLVLPDRLQQLVDTFVQAMKGKPAEDFRADAA